LIGRQTDTQTDRGREGGGEEWVRGSWGEREKKKQLAD